MITPGPPAFPCSSGKRLLVGFTDRLPVEMVPATTLAGVSVPGLMRASYDSGENVYGFLVFLGTAGLGFVVLPTVGHATGLFPVDTEAEAAFSMVTLKAVPFLASLSTAAGLSYYQWLEQISVARRLAVYFATTLLAWVTAAAIAVFILG